MKRLTRPEGFSEEMDMTQELGYSHIYQKLSEYENTGLDPLGVRVLKEESDKPPQGVKSHCEAAIYKGCVSLMRSVFTDMLDFMDSMELDYSVVPGWDSCPDLRYSTQEIVRRLFLCETTHAGGKATRRKCYELGFPDGGGVEVFIPEFRREEI